MAQRMNADQLDALCFMSSEFPFWNGSNSMINSDTLNVKNVFFFFLSNSKQIVGFATP